MAELHDGIDCNVHSIRRVKRAGPLQNHSLTAATSLHPLIMEHKGVKLQQEVAVVQRFFMNGGKRPYCTQYQVYVREARPASAKGVVEGPTLFTLVEQTFLSAAQRAESAHRTNHSLVSWSAER
jgi:hypothetical protein